MKAFEADSTFDPKISLRYQATDDLVLRVKFIFQRALLNQLFNSDVGLEGIQDYDTDGNAVGGTCLPRTASLRKQIQI